MAKNFADKLIDAIKKKGNPICVGLDPRLNQIPEFILGKIQKNTDLSPTEMAAEAIIEFNKGI